MSTTYDSTLSLVERKKLQWAKEKGIYFSEELAALNKHWIISEENCTPVVRDSRQIKRRGSLPPLYKNQYNSCDKFDRDKEIGGETSGYGSDNPNQSPDYIQTWNNQSGYESSSSRDDRMKWSDKGVGVGKFWQSKEESLDKTDLNEPPNWVKRGLKGEEIIINNTSPAESPEQRFEEERPQTGSSSSLNRNTYLRGQNIPIDSEELAERERRRQLALAHQEAIRQQLQERERKRQEEKERKIKEEYEEEQRIEREQEIERKRKEQEYKVLQEKLERERKRKEAIEEAIELAQKEALLAKTRKNKLNNAEKNKFLDIPKDISVENNLEVIEKKNNTNNAKLLHNITDNDINNNLEIRGKSISPRQCIETKETSPRRKEIAETQNVSTIDNNLTLVIPATIENFQNVHYALLIPATPQQEIIPARTENRILTPTQFREKTKTLSDSSTQTEESIFVRTESSCEKIEVVYENRSRKERRSRSESLEERPKWGVNVPPTRYVKQSEKDPLYQRRKLRKNIKEIKNYDDKNSSDESPTASPRIYRKKGSIEKRYSRNNWRKEDLLTRNVRMYQTEVVPLESDKDHIYYKRRDCCCFCRCSRHRCSEESVKVDILKIEHNSPREKTSIYQNEIEETEKLPDLNTLDKLTSLHNGLLIKQEQWDNATLPTHPVSTS